MVVNVYQDRESHGSQFDETMMNYLKWKQTQDAKGGGLRKQNEDGDDKEGKKTAAVVYNAFNMETMIKNMKAGRHKKKDGMENERDDDNDAEGVEIIKL